MTTYSTGTVSIGNGSTTLAGSGTAWSTSGVRAGDRFEAKGLSVPIASVNSNTSITLARPWPGSALSSDDYDIWLAFDDDRALVAINALLQKLTGGTLTSLGGLSGAPDKMPYWAGAGVMAETDLTAAARALLSRSTKANMRTELELVKTTSATDTTSGRITRVGDHGMGRTSDNILTVPDNDTDQDRIPAGIYSSNTSTAGTEPDGSGTYRYMSLIALPSANGGYNALIGVQSHNSSGPLPGGLFYRSSNSGSPGPWHYVWTSRNTTVDTSGFVKEASPIAKVFADHVEVNDAAEGVTWSREGVGVYRLHSCELARTGWRVEVPTDDNGNRLIHVTITNDGDGVLIETREPEWSEGMLVGGDPVDIPAGRWVDVRLHEEPVEDEDE